MIAMVMECAILQPPLNSLALVILAMPLLTALNALLDTTELVLFVLETPNAPIPHAVAMENAMIPPVHQLVSVTLVMPQVETVSALLVLQDTVDIQTVPSLILARETPSALLLCSHLLWTLLSSWDMMAKST